MNFKVDRKEEVDVNITPLIDVVFLLLIFFMVSTTFEHESEINITLPEASREYVDSKPDVIRIAVDANERVFINDRPLLNSQLITIKEALRDSLHDREDVPVVINADAETSHQSVIKVMDAARQLGLVKITFATQILDEAEP